MYILYMFVIHAAGECFNFYFRNVWNLKKNTVVVSIIKEKCGDESAMGQGLDGSK